MRWLVLLALLTNGCFLADCPRGNNWCEDSVLYQCQSVCTGSSKTNRSCNPSVTSTDCATVFPGVRKTCRTLTDEGRNYAVCIDAELKPCTPDPAGGRRSKPLACLPTGHILQCYTLGSEAFENTEACTRPELGCHATGTGIACVDSPKVPCDPARYPRCDGTLDRQCIGSGDAGWFQLTNDCGANRGCAVSDAGRTYCFDRLDGG